MDKGSYYRNIVIMDKRPIRCYRCGKILKWEKYDKETTPVNIILNSSECDKNEILDKLGYRRYCCRLAFLSDPREHLKDHELYA